jgi:transcriptional regulator with XRE-family HTH domain
MSNPTKSTAAKVAEDPFAALFAQAEKSPIYWEERARLEFTEKVLERMQEIGINRRTLAERLGAQPGFVTRLLSGKNNFEIATMVRISRALETTFRCHLEPKGTEAMWINVLREEPEQMAPAWPADNFVPLTAKIPSSVPHESFATAA